jgi:flavorubredoxin
MFKEMKIETVEPGMAVKWRASHEDERACYEFGRQFARRTREYHKGFPKG